ncbi:MAG: hypothetical protein E7578_05650 [Ruminococcaceae bacterium]|nr:hypothetical protein [Oscillospiraceae bacterium]
MNNSPGHLLTGEEKAALSYIPDRISSEIRKYAALYGGMINEIRLRSGGLLSLTIMGENISCNVTVTEKECTDTFMRLCRNSIYSCTDSLKEGFITTPEGIRAGVCGRAVCENGEITSVSGTNSICIRIPRRVPGAGDVAYELLNEMKFRKGILVWSVPGMGKTTLLRELIVRLSNGSEPLRVAVVDTRHELGAGIGKSGLIDVLDGYPRSKGIEIAKRTMSPELIVCDEIATTADAKAILEAAGSGIPIVASVHAGSREELSRQGYLKDILKSGVIGALVGLLEQTLCGYRYDIYRFERNTVQQIFR